MGVQIGGLQTTIQEQQNKITALESEKNKLAEQIAAVEGEGKKASEGFALQVADMRRSRNEVKKSAPLLYRGKEDCRSGTCRKAKAITGLQKAKETLEKELAKIKEEGSGSAIIPDTSAAPEGGKTIAPASQPKWDLPATPATEELDKTLP